MVAAVMLAGVLGALALLFFARRTVVGHSTARSIALGAAMLAAVAASAPYLYSVVHSKEEVGDSSLMLTALRVMSVGFSVAFVAVLAYFQRWMLRDRTAVTRFVVVASALVTICALAIPLPGPNNFDKPPFLVFFPLAVVGGWSLVDLHRRKPATAIVVALVGLVPVTALALAAAFNTPAAWALTPDERDLARWISENTPREAVLMDDHPRLPFIVLGPRRHYWGLIHYAKGWGYDRVEMSKRYHAWRTVYGSRALDANTLRELAKVDAPLYLVARADRHDEHTNLIAHPEYFPEVHRSGGLSLHAVDRERCRSGADSLTVLSDEELLTELGY
jgi:MFS family permease